MTSHSPPLTWFVLTENICPFVYINYPDCLSCYFVLCEVSVMQCPFSIYVYVRVEGCTHVDHAELSLLPDG